VVSEEYGLFVLGDPQERDEIEQLFRQIGEFSIHVIGDYSEIRQAVNYIGEQRPDCVLLDARMGGLDERSVRLIRETSRRRAGKAIGIVGLIHEGDEDAQLRLRAWGVRGIVTRPLDPEALVLAIQKAIANAEQDEAPVELVKRELIPYHQQPIKYRTIAVTGAPGSGSTTLATNLAAGLAYLAGVKTILLDFATIPTIASALCLREAEDRNIYQLALDYAAGRLTMSQALEQHLLSYAPPRGKWTPGGKLWVLAGPPRVDAWTVEHLLNKEVIEDLVGTSASEYLTVIDFGSQAWWKPARFILKKVDLVLFTVTPTVTGVDQGALMLDHLFTMMNLDADNPGKRVSLVANGFEQNVSLILKEVAKRIDFAVDLWGNLPRASAEVESAVSKALVPVLSPTETDFTARMKGVIGHIAALPMSIGAEARPGLLRRLRFARSAKAKVA